MCSIFIEGKHMCSNISVPNKLFCKEHLHISPVSTDTCNICLDQLDENVYMKCGHSFHKECISKWLVTKKTCPCCRKTLRVETLNTEQASDFNQIFQHILVQADELDRIILAERFIIWFHEIVHTYVHDMTNVSFRDMLNAVYNTEYYSYIMNVYNTDTNNQPFDLFLLEININQIADEVRMRQFNIQIDESLLEDDYENDISNMIDISELEFTTFEYEPVSN